MTINDFQVGDSISFGRRNGQQTLGTVVAVNRVKLKVRQDEARGRSRNHAVGAIWTVSPGLCTKVGASAPAKRPGAVILAEALSIIECDLSPENLHCDGEITPAAARRKAQSLRRRFKDLEAELGRPITEYGDIDGMMPATVRFAPTRSAKDAGFAKGDPVEFEAKGRGMIGGWVKRVNQKTITVQPFRNGSRYWRVSPGLLRHAV